MTSGYRKQSFKAAFFTSDYSDEGVIRRVEFAMTNALTSVLQYIAVVGVFWYVAHRINAAALQNLNSRVVVRSALEYVNTGGTLSRDVFLSSTSARGSTEGAAEARADGRRHSHFGWRNFVRGILLEKKPDLDREVVQIP
ncbi:hypothetical protein J6590_057801 [Homalodisca vitripennis]|nr:hypothetical protein J6590_057801 [Homalodisca vitripennis]